MSSRYKIIVGVLDDPLNLACVLRELRRREKVSSIKILPPSINVGEKVMFPTFREYLRMKRIQPTNPYEIDYEAELFETNEGWFITMSDGNEVGPFDSLKQAKSEVCSIYSTMGYVILSKDPWDDEDTSTFPL